MLCFWDACEIILRDSEELPLASRLSWSLRNTAFGSSTGKGRKRGALISHFVVNTVILSALGFFFFFCLTVWKFSYLVTWLHVIIAHTGDWWLSEINSISHCQRSGTQGKTNEWLSLTNCWVSLLPLSCA